MLSIELPPSIPPLLPSFISKNSASFQRSREEGNLNGAVEGRHCVLSFTGTLGCRGEVEMAEKGLERRLCDGQAMGFPALWVVGGIRTKYVVSK